jgi:hypothetical protein
MNLLHTIQKIHFYGKDKMELVFLSTFLF